MATVRIKKYWAGLISTVVLVSTVALPASQAAPKVTLSIWTYGNVLDPVLVARYEKLNPNIKIQAKKNDLDGSAQSLRYALPSTAVPDIAAIEISYMGEFRNYTQYFTDLNEMTPSASTIESNFLGWRWSQMVADTGQTLGIPTDVGGLAVAYRTDLFKKAGLPTDREAVSKLWPTWDAFIATGK